MGSERFQSEYIEYLQNKNAELLNRLAKMKEIYENKIFSNDLNQHYFISTLVDVINVCAAIPEEIDMLFDKMSEAMSVLINVLSRKSALVQLGEKISKLLNRSDNGDVIDVQSAEENNNSKISRKAGTVKVSPMINGHIISTEPRICLNRVSGSNISNRSDSHRLSPILEISPDVTSDSSDIKNHNLKELRVISERLNLNQATYNCISQESPKGRFKGTKIWKKSLSSNQQTQNKKDSHLLQSNENVEKLNNGDAAQPQSSENDIDPMEGPSWLYDNQKTNSSPKCFIDFRRRRHRYARVFDKDKDDITRFNKESKADAVCENTPSGDSCNEYDSANDLKSLNSESSQFLLESDEEYTPCTKKPKSLRKRKKCNYNENGDSDMAPTRKSSLRFSNIEEKKSSDISDSSYEGDNEENSSEKCKTTEKLYKSNSLKSLLESGSGKSLPRETSEDLDRFDCQENQISPKGNKECLKPMSYDINFLIKDALGREAQIPIEDCMKGKEDFKRENLGRVTSNTRSKSQSKSSTLRSSNEKKITEISIDRSLTNQNQRSRRKAAPTNLTEPKLRTKLRRS